MVEKNKNNVSCEQISNCSEMENWETCPFTFENLCFKPKEKKNKNRVKNKNIRHFVLCCPRHGMVSGHLCCPPRVAGFDHPRSCSTVKECCVLCQSSWNPLLLYKFTFFLLTVRVVYYEKIKRDLNKRLFIVYYS
jgi:hypothetical protein